MSAGNYLYVAFLLAAAAGVSALRGDKPDAPWSVLLSWAITFLIFAGMARLWSMRRSFPYRIRVERRTP